MPTVSPLCLEGKDGRPHEDDAQEDHGSGHHRPQVDAEEHGAEDWPGSHPHHLDDHRSQQAQGPPRPKPKPAASPAQGDGGDGGVPGVQTAGPGQPHRLPHGAGPQGGDPPCYQDSRRCSKGSLQHFDATNFISVDIYI